MRSASGPAVAEPAEVLFGSDISGKSLEERGFGIALKKRTTVRRQVVIRCTPDNSLLTTYNVADDFRSDCTTRRLATAVGIASAIRSNLVAGEARIGRALQRISPRNRLGSTDARGDDRNLHAPVRGNLQSQIQRK